MAPRLSVRASTVVSIAMIAAGTATAQLHPESGRWDASFGLTGARQIAPTERLLTLHVNRAPLRDVLKLIELSCHVRFAAQWADADHTEGLQPDAPVDLDARAMPVLIAVETLLAQTDPTSGGGPTWQLAADGTIQIGPRSRLNAFARTEVYDVHDLLFQVKDSREAATIDLQSALQASQGGGASTSVLREPQTDTNTFKPRDAGAELVEIITQFVEPDQWDTNGGSGASLRLYHDCLIVKAPGYVHRKLKTTAPLDR